MSRDCLSAPLAQESLGTVWGRFDAENGLVPVVLTLWNQMFGNHSCYNCVFPSKARDSGSPIRYDVDAMCRKTPTYSGRDWDRISRAGR